MEQISIEIDSITKQFKDDRGKKHTILDGISFKVKK